MDSKNIVFTIIDWSKSIGLAFVLAIVINIFVLEPFMVSGSSMEPTMHGEILQGSQQVQQGDKVLAWKLSYLFKDPQFGDIVILDSRVTRERQLSDALKESTLVTLARKVIQGKEPSRANWVKRVVGEPGDVIEFIGGQLYRNGELVVESYIYEPMQMPNLRVVVPEESVYVLGDNRNNSEDSRAIGPVPYSHIRGKVIFRYGPLSSFTKF